MNTMTFQPSNLRKTGLLTGISLLLMAVVAGLIMGLVNGQIVVPGNYEATYQNLLAHKSTFLMGIMGWIVILVLDVIVAIGLHRMYRNRNLVRSKVTLILRLTYCGFLVAGIVANFITVYKLEHLETSSQYGIMGSFYAFEICWSMGLVVFGMHLIALAKLVCNQGFIRKGLGILLWAAGMGYVLVHGAKNIFPAAESFAQTAEMIFMLPMILGEVGLAIWLIVKGGKSSAAGINLW